MANNPFRSNSFFTRTEEESAALKQAVKESRRPSQPRTEDDSRIASVVQEVLDAHEANDQELLEQRLQELRECVG